MKVYLTVNLGYDGIFISVDSERFQWKSFNVVVVVHNGSLFIVKS